MSQTSQKPPSPVAVGFVVFAGIAMVIIGVFHAFQGLVALFNTTSTSSTKSRSSVRPRRLGLIHLIVSIGVAVAGFFLFRRRLVPGIK